MTVQSSPQDSTKYIHLPRVCRVPNTEGSRSGSSVALTTMVAEPPVESRKLKLLLVLEAEPDFVS